MWRRGWRARLLHHDMLREPLPQIILERDGGLPPLLVDAVKLPRGVERMVELVLQLSLDEQLSMELSLQLHLNLSHESKGNNDDGATRAQHCAHAGDQATCTRRARRPIPSDHQGSIPCRRHATRLPSASSGLAHFCPFPRAHPVPPAPRYHTTLAPAPSRSSPPYSPRPSTSP